jgi:hypothetical protein
MTSLAVAGADADGDDEGAADASPPPMVSSTSPRRMLARDVTASQGTLGRGECLPGRPGRRGCPGARGYASADYGDALTKIGAVKSMSRKGDCWDNAVAESFFATIKGETIDHEDYLTRRAAIAAIANYIEGFYNPCRRHSALGYVSPIEFALKFMSEKIEKVAA